MMSQIVYVSVDDVLAFDLKPCFDSELLGKPDRISAIRFCRFCEFTLRELSDVVCITSKREEIESNVIGLSCDDGHRHVYRSLGHDRQIIPYNSVAMNDCDGPFGGDAA